MMESGPVGGIIASTQTGKRLGFPSVISFDMGGTTATASLVRDDEPTMSPGCYVGGQPVMLPMIDMVEVGAGGGSIAWRDEVGALKVGPHSAGADRGPICYGGGTEPTITDANVVLGRLDPDNLLGGQMKLDAAPRQRGSRRRPAGDGYHRGRPGDRRDRHRQDVARGAGSGAANRSLWRLSAAPAGRERIPIHGGERSPGAGAVGDYRTYRRRRLGDPLSGNRRRCAPT
jgi:hypothetical protein